MRIDLFVVTFTATLLVACTPVQLSAPPVDPTTVPPVESTTPSLAVVDKGLIVQENVIVTEKPTEGNQPMQPQVTEAIHDLAEKLGLSPSQIEIASVDAVTWRDGSLGCPQPGMVYTQALQDGLLIRLRAEGVIYHYHSGGQRSPFLCMTPAKPLPPGAGGEDS